MNVRHVGIALGVLILATAATAAAVDDDSRPVQQGAPVADVLATRVVIGVAGGATTAAADGLESGSGFGGRGAFFFHRNVGVEVGVRRQSFDVVGTEANALSGGSLDTTVVTGNLVGRFGASPRIAPYVTGGVAFFSHGLEVDSAVTRPLSAVNFDLDEQLDSSVGLNVGGGVDVLLGGRFGVFGDLRYFAASSDTSATLTDRIGDVAATVGGSQDVNGLAVSGGVRIFF